MTILLEHLTGSLNPKHYTKLQSPLFIRGLKFFLCIKFNGGGVWWCVLK